MSRLRSRTMILAPALGVALAAATALPAVAGDGPETTTDGGKTVLKLVEKETGGQYVPKGGKPQDFPEDEDFVPDVGDAFTFTSDLLQGGTEVGTNNGRCTVVNLETHTERCVVTFTFANGTFVADGTIDFPEEDGPFSFKVGILSGTGAFAGARGALTVTTHEESNDLTAVFTTGGGQVSEVPSGGAATGGGLGDSSSTAGLIGLGALACVAGLGAMAGGRRLAAMRR